MTQPSLSQVDLKMASMEVLSRLGVTYTNDEIGGLTRDLEALASFLVQPLPEVDAPTAGLVTPKRPALLKVT